MNPSLLREKLWVLSCFLIVNRCAKTGVFGEIVSQPFQPISMWFPSSLPDLKGSLCQVLGFFRGSCSTYCCKVGMCTQDLPVSPS